MHTPPRHPRPPLSPLSLFPPSLPPRAGAWSPTAQPPSALAPVVAYAGSVSTEAVQYCDTAHRMPARHALHCELKYKKPQPHTDVYQQLRKVLGLHSHRSLRRERKGGRGGEREREKEKKRARLGERERGEVSARERGSLCSFEIKALPCTKAVTQRTEEAPALNSPFWSEVSGLGSRV
eukprot:1366999-Rhodomonas_salina.1